MLIEFDIRPGDSRAFEQWRGHHSPFTPARLRLLQLGAFVGAGVYSYRYESNFFLVTLAFNAALIAPLIAWACLIRWRYRMTAAPLEGHHSLHFSAEGVHHVAPDGVHRYPWTSFEHLEVTVGYLFLRFADHGTLPIPVTALKAFGPACDEAFLAELAPLIHLGRRPGP